LVQIRDKKYFGQFELTPPSNKKPKSGKTLSMGKKLPTNAAAATATAATGGQKKMAKTGPTLPLTGASVSLTPPAPFTVNPLNVGKTAPGSTVAAATLPSKALPLKGSFCTDSRCQSDYTINDENGEKERMTIQVFTHGKIACYFY
jgi:hypothetical protein